MTTLQSSEVTLAGSATDLSEMLGEQISFDITHNMANMNTEKLIELQKSLEFMSSIIRNART